MKNELRHAAVLMLLGLYGCGLKGPLYSPPVDKADKSEQKHQLTIAPSSTQSPMQTALPEDDGDSGCRRDRTRTAVIATQSLPAGRRAMLRYRLLSGV